MQISLRFEVYTRIQKRVGIGVKKILFQTFLLFSEELPRDLFFH